MCWACKRGLFSLTGKTGDGNIPVSIPCRPRAWGHHQPRDQFRLPPNFMPKLLCARQIRPCPCWMHIVSVLLFTDPTAHRLTRAALLAPWCFGNDVYSCTYRIPRSHTRTHSHTHVHAFPQVAPSLPRSFGFSPLPLLEIRSPPSPLLVSYFEPKGAAGDKDRHASRAAKTVH